MELSGIFFLFFFESLNLQVSSSWEAEKFPRKKRTRTLSELYKCKNISDGLK